MRKSAPYFSVREECGESHLAVNSKLDRVAAASFHFPEEKKQTNNYRDNYMFYLDINFTL